MYGYVFASVTTNSSIVGVGGGDNFFLEISLVTFFRVTIRLQCSADSSSFTGFPRFRVGKI